MIQPKQKKVKGGNKTVPHHMDTIAEGEELDDSVADVNTVVD